ncbi:MAG: hypothetical protein GWP47_13840 [Actinobacteria bacterium]|jgi:hypothetical protein|nr:hypothetical protein [Actinomycetota bacterium]
MSQFLSEDWFTEATATLAALPPAGDASAVLQYAISGGPDGKVTCHAVIEGGVVTGIAPGKADSPDVVATLSFDEARALLSGEHSTDASFMRGAVKIEGDHVVWLLELRDVREAAFAALAPITSL